jgi:hypothetical protein
LTAFKAEDRERDARLHLAAPIAARAELDGAEMIAADARALERLRRVE